MKTIKNTAFAKRCNEARKTIEYKLERAKMDFTDGIYARLDELGMNQRQLADIMGVSRSQVSNILNCNYRNLTFETAVRIANAINMDFEPMLASRSDHVGASGNISIGLASGVIKAKATSPWHNVVFCPESGTHNRKDDCYDYSAIANG